MPSKQMTFPSHRVQPVCSETISIDMDAGVKRLPIAAVGENMTNVLLVGMIIAKQNPRKVTCKSGPSSGSERSVWNFTLRDSPHDLINATFWGSPDYIQSHADKFHVGHVVEISKPKISLRCCDEQEDRFSPSVTSPFQLTLSEKQTSLVPHEAEYCDEFLYLLHLPTKPPGDYFTLADVYRNGTSIRGEFVNLLVAVRDIGPMRHIKTKDGRDMDCRDVMVFDQTNTGLRVSLWNTETVHRADNWRPRETVLFLADMRLEWNAFRRGMVASDGSRSIVTEDPETPEAAALRMYARTVPLRASAILDQLANSIPDPSSITNVMTVQQVLDRATAGSPDNSGGDDSQFTALLYCLLTKYDLDGCSQLIITKCSQCQMPVQDMCINLECPIGCGAELPRYDVAFDLRIKLSDHTGSLENVRLSGGAAERIIGCTVNEFMSMPLDMKTHLKWKLCLERCAARILVLRSSDRPRPLISLLSCTVADPSEAAACIPVY